LIKTLKSIFTPLSFSCEEEKREVFNQIYLENQEFIRTTIYWMVRNQNIDDIVQETFLKAWNKLDTFNNKSSYKTWLYRIAMNTTYDSLKKHKEQSSDEIEASINTDNTLKDLITKGLLKLKAKHREVFILYYKLEYTNTEIAKLLGISEGTVKSRVHYAKEDFTKFLKENGVDHD